MVTKYRAMAAPIDKSTGDARRFAPDAITIDNPPLPIRYVPQDVGGHDGAMVVGRFDDIEVGDEIWGVITMFDDVDPEKMPRLAEAVQEAMKYMDEGVVGLSVDLDDFDAVVVNKDGSTPTEAADEEDLELLITRGRVRGATLVDIPAFAETKGKFERLQDAGLTASVAGDTDLPVYEDRSYEWDGPAAAARMLDSCTDEDGNIDVECASRGFLWVDNDGSNRGDYKLPFADIIDGELMITARGVAATAGGRGVGSTKGVAKEAVKAKICALYERLSEVFEDWPECPFATDEDMALIASTATVNLVPLEVFMPGVMITAPTPMTYDFDRGIVYGHIFQHGVCHVGIPHECRTPPVDEDFRHFHVYPVETTEGTVYAGRITAGGGHPDRSLSLNSVRNAYDQKTTVAYVRAHVDEYGIFVCGPLEKDLDNATLKILARRKVSGHWPEVGDQGDIYLAEILALADGKPQDSEPGFPIGVHVHAGRITGMTASLGPVPKDAKVNIASTAEGFAILTDAFLKLAAQFGGELNNALKFTTPAVLELESAMEADTEAARKELLRQIGE